MIEKTDHNKPIFSEEFNIDGTFTIKKEDIVNQMKEVFDPEIPVNIYDLGLIYEIKIDEEKKVEIIMTLTSPNCPVAESLPIDPPSSTGFPVTIAGVYPWIDPYASIIQAIVCGFVPRSGAGISVFGPRNLSILRVYLFVKLYNSFFDNLFRYLLL